MPPGLRWRPSAQTLDLVEAVAARIEQVVWRMVDIGKDRVEAPSWLIRIEPVVSGHGEEIAFNQPAPAIVGEQRSKGKNAGFVPLDNGGKVFDHQQVRDPCLGQNGLGGVAETEPAHHDVECIAWAGFDTKSPECNLGRSKMAGHQEFLTKHDFPDIHAQPQISASAETERADRCRAVIEFLEQMAHVIGRRGSHGRLSV